MKPYPEIPLVDVLIPERNVVSVEPNHTYRTAGIFSFGKGLFEREPITGADTRYKTYTRLNMDQVVYSRLFAWEGAVAVVPPAFDGLFVSQEFPTFHINESVADPSYVAALCLWPRFHELLAKVTKGLGLRRQRVHPEQFLAIKIPLPDLDEQRRVAARLSRLRALTTRALQTISRSRTEKLISLYPAIVDSVLRQHAVRTSAIGDLVDLISDVVHPGDNAKPAQRFVGLQHIESHTGRRIGEHSVGGETGRKFRFSSNDVIYGYLRPYLNKVWLADCDGLCSVDQYVLRPRAGLGALLAHTLRSRTFLNEAIRLTHNLQLPRLRSGLLLQTRVPVVPGGDEHLVVTELDATLNRVLRLIDLRRHAERAQSALEVSLLNRAFVGQL